MLVLLLEVESDSSPQYQKKSYALFACPEMKRNSLGETTSHKGYCCVNFVIITDNSHLSYAKMNHIHDIVIIPTHLLISSSVHDSRNDGLKIARLRINLRANG